MWIIPDTVQHAVLDCDAWLGLRTEIRVYTGEELTADNVTRMMISSKENWKRIDAAIGKIIRTREEVEREKERRTTRENNNTN